MHTKPVSPVIHGIIDYVFSGIQLAAPSSIRLNTTAVKVYRVLGAGFLVINALTDTPAGIKPAISFKGHQKTDAVFLAGLALLTSARFICRNRKPLVFHLSFLSVAISHYLLTDYNSGSGA